MDDRYRAKSVVCAICPVSPSNKNISPVFGLTLKRGQFDEVTLTRIRCPALKMMLVGPKSRLSR